MERGSNSNVLESKETDVVDVKYVVDIARMTESRRERKVSRESLYPVYRSIKKPANTQE